VCAWIECEAVTVGPVAVKPDPDGAIHYNPRIHPFWRNAADANIDNQRFETIISTGRQLFAA